MIKINREKLQLLMDGFNAFIINQSPNGRFSSFEENDCLYREEGYKIKISDMGKQILTEAEITSEDIGTGKIKDTVFRIFNVCQNLVNYNQIIHAKNKCDGNLERAEQILYNIYYGENEKNAFENAIKFFGKKYDLIAYLFFIKDRTRFLPIRATEFDKRFEILNINFKAAFQCSWDNYVEYIGIIKEIRHYLEEYLGITVQLIDAHSFVWMLSWINCDDKIPTEIIETEIKFIATKPVQKEKEQVCFARIGQSTFRKNVFIHWNNACSITGCKNSDFLIASHIKPWRDCKENNEWVNPFNGLLLTPNLDRAFDSGYISFKENGEILISSNLDNETQELLGISNKIHLKKVCSEMLPFLEYHRLNIFKR